MRDAGSLDGAVTVNKLVEDDGWVLAVLMGQIVSIRARVEWQKEKIHENKEEEERERKAGRYLDTGMHKEAKTILRLSLEVPAKNSRI